MDKISFSSKECISGGTANFDSEGIMLGCTELVNRPKGIVRTISNGIKVHIACGQCVGGDIPMRYRKVASHPCSFIEAI